MTEPRDPTDDEQPLSSAMPSPDDHRAPDDDLTASAELEAWLGSARNEPLSDRGAAMLAVRDVLLRSRHDMATSGELEDLLTGAMRRMDHGTASVSNAPSARTHAAARSRHRATRLRWITAAAAAAVLFAGIGTLLAQGTGFEESAGDSGSSAEAVDDAASAGSDSGDAIGGPETGPGGSGSVEEPGAGDNGNAPGADATTSIAEDFAAPSDPAELDGSQRSEGPAPDGPEPPVDDEPLATDPETDSVAPGSAFAGVRGTGSIRLR